jgi:hypothetical protein
MSKKNYINKGYSLADVLKQTVVTIVNQQLKQEFVQQDGEAIDVQQKAVKATVVSVDRFVIQGANILGTITVLLSTGTSVDIPVEGQTIGGARGEVISALGIWPANGSEVSVISVEGDYKIVGYTQIQTIDINAADKIYIAGDGGTILGNDGSLGGLIIIEELTNKINDLVTEINSLKDVFNSHIHTTTATITPGVVGVITPSTSKAQGASTFDKADYEDGEVTH